MRFRLKAFAVHLASSISALSIILGGLYIGWYYWPGWYLTSAAHVVLIMILVDVALGPILTLVIANPSKPRYELMRDIAVIVTVQLIALAYGTFTLWHGRPLYYAFSVDRLQLVQASDVSAHERELARKVNPRFAPAWYDRPRWVWAPLPDDPNEQRKILSTALFGGKDVIDMPRYFKPWIRCSAEVRKHLKKIEQLATFSHRQRMELIRRVAALSLSTAVPDSLILTGPGPPLVTVFDTRNLKIRAILAAD